VGSGGTGAEDEGIRVDQRGAVLWLTIDRPRTGNALTPDDRVRLAVRLAAAEAGIPAFDGSLAAVAQPERCRAEAEAARRLGFAGKSCIHPSQVPIVNAVFVPRPEEVARARRILDAARQAEARGVGAVLVDGQMVDGPYVESAQAVLDLAASFGLGEEGAT